MPATRQSICSILVYLINPPPLTPPPPHTSPQMCTAEEHRTIDTIIDNGNKVAGSIDRQIVLSESPVQCSRHIPPSLPRTHTYLTLSPLSPSHTQTELYNRGLIYLNIPIADTDVIVVPPLQGFVMNRVQGDYFETLLYKIFVSIDEHTNIEELSSVLQVDLELVKVGVASCHVMEWVWFYCFAHVCTTELLAVFLLVSGHVTVCARASVSALRPVALRETGRGMSHSHICHLLPLPSSSLHPFPLLPPPSLPSPPTSLSSHLPPSPPLSHLPLSSLSHSSECSVCLYPARLCSQED